MNMKRGVVAAAVVVLAAMAFIGAVTTSAQSASFTDLTTSYDYYDAVNYLQGENVVQGYDDGTYKPDNTINRAEFVKIVLLSAGQTPEGGNCFPDVTDQWFAPYVCKAKDLGLVQGYPDGLFKPERAINFVESGKVVSEGLDVSPDEAALETWYHKYIAGLEGQDAIPESVGTFDQYINRGEMAEMIWRVQTVPGETSAKYDDLKESTEEQAVHTITSCSQLQERFEAEGSDYYGYYEDDVVFSLAVDGEVGAVEPAVTDQESSNLVKSAVSSEEVAAPDYSETNVQVEGVDEADIVKTDGEYIYVVKGDTVRVVKAYHPNDLRELDAVTFADDGFNPRDMYVDGDKLVVIGTSYYSYPYPLRDSMEIAPYPYYGGALSKVYIFDISDKENITEFRSLGLEGSYSQSRKVDDMVYVVLNRYGFWAYDEIVNADEIMPYIKEGDSEVAELLVGCTDVKYIPAMQTSNYLIVVGIPINDADAEVSKEVILGQSENMYASRDNLYVTSTNYNWDYSNGSETTNVYKFSLGRDDIEFEAKGNVPGRILNQFSMDEYKDHFRIATTKGHSWDNNSDNNVYTFDSEMNMSGKLEGLAPGEEIYSMRFVGDRGYMVTFKKIDPFYVLDLSDARYPSVLGKLKIPGYSDYLHPYDENHIIGFGKETIDPAEFETMDFDFAWYQGIKIALFDVTDVENPVQMHKEIIGDRGTESPLLSDHKALLFDKERNLLALPITLAEIPEVEKDPDMPSNTYGEFTFQGAYVYNLTLEDGFELMGTITHYDETEVADKSGYYWYGSKDVQRILYIGDYLYTVSQGMVKANSLSDELGEVNSVELGGTENYGYVYPELI